MNQKNFFLNPENSHQRQYEALKAFFCDGLSIPEITQRFGFSKHYFNKLKYQFNKDLAQKINPYFEDKKPGPKQPRTDPSIIEIVVMLRKQNYAITDTRV
jgi:transposase